MTEIMIFSITNCYIFFVDFVISTIVKQNVEYSNFHHYLSSTKIRKFRTCSNVCHRPRHYSLELKSLETGFHPISMSS